MDATRLSQPLVQPLPSSSSISVPSSEPTPTPAVDLAAVQATLANARWFTPKNILWPITDSSGFVLLTDAVLKYRMITSTSEIDTTQWSEDYLMQESTIRAEFREACWLTTAAIVLKFIEAIFWIIVGIPAVFVGKVQPLQEGMRCSIQTVANILISVITFVGMFKPDWADGMAIRLVEMTKSWVVPWASVGNNEDEYFRRAMDALNNLLPPRQPEPPRTHERSESSSSHVRSDSASVPVHPSSNLQPQQR